MSMSKKLIQRERVLAKLVSHVLKSGLSQTSLRQLAAAADISDRMLLYYFDDKAEVLTAVLAQIAGGLAGQLGEVVPDGVRLAPGELVTRTAHITRSAEMAPFMRLAIEVIAAASRKEAPFDTIAGMMVGGFHLWVDSHLDIEDAGERRAVAALMLAMVDGLALLDVCLDRETLDGAAAAMGRIGWG